MGLLRMAARTAVVAGTATAVSGRVARRQAARYEQKAEAQQYEQQQYAQQPQQYAQPQQYQTEPAAPAAPPDDTIAKLQQLAQLHEQGVLSPAEFSAAKAKLLGL
jgi:hypothetical protein